MSVWRRLGQQGDLGLQTLKDLLFGKNLQAGQGRSASHGIAGIGMTVKEGFELFVGREKGRKNLFGRQGGRKRQIAAGHALGHAEQVRADGGMFAGKHFPGAPKPGSHLVTDQENTVLPGKPSQGLHIFDRLRPHAGCALHERFDNHRGQLFMLPGEYAFGLFLSRSECLLWLTCHAQSETHAAGSAGPCQPKGVDKNDEKARSSPR